MRKKSIEELQAELTLEAEALATLQIIYAEKVKQVRTNTGLPPDIQARFLSEWETFYQQRVASIFRKDYQQSGPVEVESASLPSPSVTPPVSSNRLQATPPARVPVQQPEPAVSKPLPAATASESNPSDDILGVNTDSWMNSAESITYEQYNGAESIPSSLMDEVKSASENLDSDYAEENDSIDGYAATSGLKGLTEFMDFDLKKKKS
jgi:hypothetical protein